MKNPLKRRKFDKIIKKDIKVKVWDYDPEDFEIGYLYGVRSKSHKLEYPYRVWDDGKTGKECDFNSYYTLSYKNAELIEELKENTIPEIQEFCDKYGVWCAMDETGEWFWYPEKPQISKNDFLEGHWTEATYSLLPFQPDFDGDWKETLHEPRGKE